MKPIFGFFTVAFLLSVHAKAQFQNITISTTSFPNEPCIAINPKNPAQLVAGSNINNVYLSTDTGHTWQTDFLGSPYGVWGDPVITTDTTGDFYFFHLSAPSNSHLAPDWLDRIVCQKMSNMSGAWSPGTYTGLNGNKDQDKEWVAVDRQNNRIYMSWSQFDLYGSTAPGDSSNILFSFSSDAGSSWSTPQRINELAGDCIDEDNTVEGAVPAVGPNGEVYIAWTGPAGIVFDRSLDGGQTWLPQDIPVTNMPGGWDFTVPGLNRCNGLPFTVCDLSGGPHHGTIYINWSDQRNGPNNTDVWLVKSTDGGDTWSAPFRVNDDNSISAHQFLSSMTVDQTTGYLYVLFYDRRNYTDDKTDVYLAYSTDGGASFINKKISTSPFTPFSNIFFGDYTYIAAHGNIIRPIWGRMDMGMQSVLTAIIDTASLFAAPTNVADVKVELESSHPNPFHETSFISFKIKDPAMVNLFVTDLFGRKVATLIDSERLTTGKYVRQFDPKEHRLPPGVYFFRLGYDDKVKTSKIIYLEQ